MVENEADLLRDRVNCLVLETHAIERGNAAIEKMLSRLHSLGFEIALKDDEQARVCSNKQTTQSLTTPDTPQWLWDVALVVSLALPRGPGFSLSAPVFYARVFYFPGR